MTDDVSVDELDARIEEQLSIIVAIDAQVVSRSAATQSGDLTREDFAAWAVRAFERRAHAASDLAGLRHRRHEAVRAETSLRIEAARLRELLYAANERLADATREHEERVARLLRNIDAAYECVTKADDRREAIQNGTATFRVRESIWRVFLEGEIAVLHPEARERFLARAGRSVPPEFRDACCEQKEACGYPRPRTSAECGVSDAGEESAAD